MRNIQLIIEYDGSRYDGWQKASAKNGNSAKGGAIQEKIEEVLEKMEGTKVELIGAIRTEAGVHAYRQVANFHTDSKKKTYEIKMMLESEKINDFIVLGPAEPYLYKLNDQYRLRLLLKYKDYKTVTNILHKVKEKMRGTSNVNLTIDVNPLED